MLDQGRVSRIENDLAWVEFAPSSQCSKCGACSQAASGKMVLEAENLVKANVGDRVVVEISEAAQTLFPLFLFGTPLLFLFLGLLLGSLISEITGIVLGIIFLVCGFLSLKLVERYVTKARRFKNRIVRKLRKEVRAMAKDPVCAMEAEEGKICSEYEGKTYCFCSEACKKTFEQDPKKYVEKKEE